MSKCLLCIMLMIYAVGVKGQSLSISGTVLAKKLPVQGATVGVNDEKSTTTDQEGNFILDKLPIGKKILKINALGFQPKEITVYLHGQDTNLGTIELRSDFLQLDQVVVTATRNQILRKDAPIVSNVLDDKVFKATQSVVLAEGLSFQPALRIENNCQNCGFNGLRMNGLEGAYSQILIDGRPIYNSLQGVYGLEQIPANMIERVEIVRSGGSTLYGSSAVAGTVNVITKEPVQPSFYISSNQALIDGKSPDQTYFVGGNILNQRKTTGISIHVFNRERNPLDVNGDTFSEIGKLKATAWNAKAFYKPSPLSKITLNGYGIYEFRRGGNKFDKPFHETDITESTTHNILNGGLTYEQYTKDKHHKFSTYLTYQYLQRDSYYGGGQDINAYGNSQDRGLVAGFQYTANLGEHDSKLGEHTLVTGIEYIQDDLNDNAPSYDRYIRQSAQQTGMYLQDLWEIKDRWNILVGTRIDYHNLVGNLIFSPRLNVLYKINPALQYRIGYARGFLAPQVFDEDLHVTQVGGGGAVLTNALHLTPEFSDAFSTSIDFSKYYKNWSLGVTVDGFYTVLTNKFVLEELGKNLAGNLLIERRNTDGEALVYGITINPKVQYKDILDIQLGFTFQQSKYDQPVQWSQMETNTNRRFFRTPNDYGFYVLSWNTTPRLTLSVSGVYTGSMIAQHYAGYIEQDRLETTDAFFEHNFKVEYRFTIKNDFNIKMSAGIQNFTNAYQSDFDLGKDRDSAYIYGPSRPRTFFIGLSIDF